MQRNSTASYKTLEFGAAICQGCQQVRGVESGKIRKHRNDKGEACKGSRRVPLMQWDEAVQSRV